MTIETLRFRNDTPARKRLFGPGAFAHPAKGHMGMWQTMIERYSQPGGLVLDPMAGIGTSLVAALMGRNVVCVELEPHFVEPMRCSWEKMRTMPMLGYEMGQVVILRGDARCLPLPDASVAAAITSPPYEGSITGDTAEATRRRIADGKYHGLRPDVFTSPGNIAGSKYGDGYTRPVDAIVTSPPFQDQVAIQDEAFYREHRLAGGRNPDAPHNSGAYSYTRPVDVVITSPPYGHDSEHDQALTSAMREPPGTSKTVAYGVTTENIGNLRNAAYWTAMRQVYAECWRVLRPGGIMALVLKGYTRAGQYVDLPGQTEALLLEAGWVKHDHWRRELWSLSFWRILQKRRDPVAWDDRLMYEEVLAFRKPEEP